MPGYLLHVGATVMCANNPRVTVSGQPTVVQSSTYSIGACPFMNGPQPSPCITAQWTVAATRITSQGQPLLLQDSQAFCAPNGTPVNIVVTQVRVKGM
jgi:hypothetical protein